jgi:hypothetical protein
VEKLDEQGFVFLDDMSRPFLCCMWGDEPWLFNWSKGNGWVSLRKVTQQEVWAFNERALPPDQAALYRSATRDQEPSLDAIIERLKAQMNIRKEAVQDAPRQG